MTPFHWMAFLCVIAVILFVVTVWLNKGNNVIENLECLPKADHTRLHAKAKKCGS